jgi:hypothetical protein
MIRSSRSGLRVRIARATLNVAALLVVLGAAGMARADERRAVLIGGGPNPKNNQVAIESNVRYMLRLLPADTQRTVLFADGDPKAETVLYEEQAKELKPGERMVTLILDGPDAAHPSTLKYRATTIPRVDGASRRSDVEALFSRLGAQDRTESPLLVYFTGHGSPARNRDLDNNVYDLWDERGLSVKELSAQLAKLPAGQPLTVVMVQCYSGAFGNLLFRNGDPQGELNDQDMAGFFATVKERVAAGCTPALDESDYHDFTSYFFAALSGQDRVGRKVKGADYDHDGRVTMDEAFCYAIAHDESIDIPVCTTEVFLRRFVTRPDADIFKHPYPEVKAWASSAQRAALEALSKRLKLSGDDRGSRAYSQFINGGNEPGAPRSNAQAAARRALSEARDEARRSLIQRWPELLDAKGAGYQAARAAASKQVEQEMKQPPVKAIVDAENALDSAEANAYRRELDDSAQIRFVRLFKSVVLTHQALSGTDESLKRGFERIAAAEHRTLFPDARVAGLVGTGLADVGSIPSIRSNKLR